jgi:hypothetical protein
VTALPVLDLEAAAIAARDAAFPHCNGSALLCGQCRHFDDRGAVGAPGQCLAANDPDELHDANGTCTRVADFTLDTRSFAERYPHYPEGYGHSLAFHGWLMTQKVRRGERIGVRAMGKLWTFEKGTPVSDGDYSR